jgi:hypothetical protein
MSQPNPPAIADHIALAKVRRYLSPLRGYNRMPEAESRLVEIVQSVCVSVEHLDATLETFDGEYPTLAEIKTVALNLRDRFLPKQPSQRERWEKEYGPPDPGWSRSLLRTATFQISAVGDKKAQYKAERYSMRLQALKDSVYYSTLAGQEEINAITRKEDRNASRRFWADAIAHNLKEYPAQIAAIRAGREPEFNEPKSELVPMRPITAESFRGIKPMRVEKCTNCGGSGRLAGDDYCDECQTGRDLRKMESSHENGSNGAA